MAKKKQLSHLSPELRQLVRSTMELLGEAYRFHYGTQLHKKFMRIRQSMTLLRNATDEKKFRDLEKLYAELKRYSAKDQYHLAKGFALMMEITNTCENAFRAYRWEQKKIACIDDPHSDVTWVLTAHPTESRSPTTLLLLENLQQTLKNSLSTSWREHEAMLRSLISLVVKSELSPRKRPRPEDEARYLFTMSLKPYILDVLARHPEFARSFKLRTWVGGDKDGHPGINEHVLKKSWELSREKILQDLFLSFDQWDRLAQLDYPKDRERLKKLRHEALSLKKLSRGDGQRVRKFKKNILSFLEHRKDTLSYSALTQKIKILLDLFPSLVMPVELRESSYEINRCLQLPPKQRHRYAIVRMLNLVSEISQSLSPSHYVQAFVVSMVHSESDLEAAWKLKKTFARHVPLPIVPLFETQDALTQSSQILKEFLQKNPAYREIVRRNWNSRVEVMMGYSDSSKQCGLLSSRVLIHQSMRAIEKELKSFHFTPYFFHGTGGSVARGGGSFEEQTQGWSQSALKHYKATLQGEVIYKTFSSSRIFLSQIDKIREYQKNAHLDSSALPKALVDFAEASRIEYEKIVHDPSFLALLHSATLYPYLRDLRIGSRPSKRQALGSVEDLRAIPWVLCWTQNRLLMPTWWGIGTAWQKLPQKEKSEIKKLYHKADGFLLTYIKQLRFTLAKVELGVWKFHLKILAHDDADFKKWKVEFEKTLKALRDITGEKDLMSFRPWLGESIFLRSSFIHPLNVLQVLAIQNRNKSLLRLTVTGIASGMLTTG